MSLSRALLALFLSLLLSINGAAAVAASLAPCPMQGGTHPATVSASPCKGMASGTHGCCDPDTPSGACAHCNACGLAGGFSPIPAFASFPVYLTHAPRAQFAYAYFVPAAVPTAIWRPPSLLS